MMLVPFKSQMQNRRDTAPSTAPGPGHRRHHRTRNGPRRAAPRTRQRGHSAQICICDLASVHRTVHTQTHTHGIEARRAHGSRARGSRSRRCSITRHQLIITMVHAIIMPCMLARAAPCAVAPHGPAHKILKAEVSDTPSGAQEQHHASRISDEQSQRRGAMCMHLTSPCACICPPSGWVSRARREARRRVCRSHAPHAQVRRSRAPTPHGTPTHQQAQSTVHRGRITHSPEHTMPCTKTGIMLRTRVHTTARKTKAEAGHAAPM